MTIVRMGNATPRLEMVSHGGAVEYTWNDRGAGLTHDPDGSAYGVAARGSGRDALLYVLTNDVTRLVGHECFVSIVRDWNAHSAVPPTYVWSDNEDLALMLSEAYGCPLGRPDDVEDLYHTSAGPPGTGPTEA